MRVSQYGAVVVVVAILALGSGSAVAQEPPPLPPPPPPVRIEPVPNGYQITLNRPAAELLQKGLDSADEKQIAATIREEAKKQKDIDPDEAAKLELIAFLVSSQVPKFRQELHDKMGANGVVIRVSGLQQPTVKFKKPRPVLERGAMVVRGVTPLLPPDAQMTIEGLRAMARTTPLTWKIEPVP
ncbi:MAG TPA: hypothetical protein VKE74_27220 [Gemmataceae bacterium]|nr:hypothetical protein [Gemmataceae bacterium]